MAVLDTADPDSGVRGSALFDIVLTGENFLLGDSVQLSADEAFNAPRTLLTHFDSDTQITAQNVNLIELAGDYFIGLKRGGAYSNALPFTIEDPAPPADPVVDEVDPNTATTGDTVDLVVTGSNFLIGDAIRLDGRGLVTTYDDSSQLFANDVEVTEDPGVYDIFVRRMGFDSNAVDFTVEAGAAYRDMIIADGAFAYWPMFDLADNVGLRNLAAATASTDQPSLIVDGPGAKGLNGFQAIGFSRADDDGLSPVAKSFEIWIKPTSIYSHIFMQHGGTRLAMRGSGAIYWQITADAGLTWIDSVVFRAVAAQLIHVVGTSQGSHHKIYINGSHDGTVDWGTALVAEAAPLVIGGGNGETPFTGTLCEVALYDFALSDAQVLAHYMKGTTGA